MSEFLKPIDTPHRNLNRSTTTAALLLVSALGALHGCNSASAQSGHSLTRQFERVGLRGVASASVVDAEVELLADGGSGGDVDEFSPEVVEPKSGDVVTDDGAVVIEPDPEPIANRVARKLLTVHAKPTKQSPIRGRIPMAKAFEVFAEVEGPGCETMWADVGSGGYVCLDRSRPAGDRVPVAVPTMRRGELTPFYYAKVRNSKKARRWKSLKAYDSGADPVDTLEKGHDYAFVTRKLYKGKVVLLDEYRRVVLESEVRRYRPSRFHGRDTVENPVPKGKHLAWVSSWPKALTYAEPSRKARPNAPLGYHDELLLNDPVMVNDEGRWVRVGVGRYVEADDLRIFTQSDSRPQGVGSDEVWIDVDLKQQGLAAMRGDTPMYVTMISSGLKSPTPRGVFRIHLKQAVGSMSSTPGADDYYSVEAVPFVQYFLGSFAFHTAYWHNAFGRPISHGCVNLSPIDAKEVFALTTPDVRPGWVHGYETEQHVGTTVQIRKGDRELRDRRADVEPVYLASVERAANRAAAE